MQEIIEEPITVKTEKPGYSEWLRSLKARAEEAARSEQEELQWRQKYGKV
jgi:hypothetical protein